MLTGMRALLVLSISLAAAASDRYPAPRFTDPQRVEKLTSGFPAVDAAMKQWAEKRGVPGMVWGVVIDGRLAHSGAHGVFNRTTGARPGADTVFRIASMTKSFTVLAVLKLRDEGKLSIEDPVSRWIPEFARMPLPTADSGVIRIRHLLTHGAGFPEDNPWGDQQLGVSDAEVTAWLKKGIPFSTPPDSRYEYSNYAFGLLGRIITAASKMPYETYLEKQILAPLGMTSSTLEAAKAPEARRAIGYRRRPDGTYSEEPPLPHGAFGAMGGLLTTTDDLARYVAFHLAAYPPRDEADRGPVKRDSVREMNRMARISNLNARFEQGAVEASVSGYGYGLRISSDCRFQHVVGHGGGLPGFGSYMMWLPEHGAGMFAMTNLTYAGPAGPINEAWNVLLKTGGLMPRELPASPMLESARQGIWSLWRKWDSAEAKKIAAMNLFLDVPEPQRLDEIAAVKKESGECSEAGPVRAENWLRGQFNMRCANATVGVFFTLAPTEPPGIQHLSFRKLGADAFMVAPTGAPAGVSCRP